MLHRRKRTPTIKTVKSACRRHRVNHALSWRIKKLTFGFCSLLGQTTRDASSTVYRMINTILERQPETIRLSSSNREMVSTGTMPRTPVKMVSLGTMPQTPTGLTSTGTMPGTPTMTSTGTLPKTPTALTSTGTMPGTPTMVSTGTMPKTPTRLATATTSFSLSDHGTIELGSPTLPVIDHVSPGSETIDLCSPETPTNTDLPQ